MPVQLPSTYTLDRPVPFFAQRGGTTSGEPASIAQTLAFPIRHGATGALVEPDAGCTVSVRKPDGTYLVNAQTATVSGSIATYNLTALATTESLGAGWEAWLVASFSGVAYPAFRVPVYVCEWVPQPCITVLGLYQEMPELRHRIPQAQTIDRGDGTGWQPQIDATYYELLQRLLDDGQSPWLIEEITGYREWMLARTLQRCVMAIEHGPDSNWAQASKELAFRVQRAEARLRFRYSDQASTIRRAASPVVSLAPVGRPVW